VDQKLKLILGLIWRLILHYSIALPVWEDDGADSTDVPTTSAGTLTPKKRLLAWIQNKIPDLTITNFTSAWSDGRAIGALVDCVAPGKYHSLYRKVSALSGICRSNVVVCVAVFRVYVTLMCRAQTTESMVTRPSPDCSSAILVYPVPNANPIVAADPPIEGVKMGDG